MSATKTKAAPASTGTQLARRPSAEAESALGELMQGARTPQERERAYVLADAMRQSRMVRSLAAIVAATEWGAAMSEARQIAFARYCAALGADPLRHVDLLGGNPFVNGDYYRDVITASGEYRRASDPRWIHDDARLKLCALCNQPFEDKPDHGHALEAVTKENTERLSQRIARAGLRVTENADENSPAVCVLLLHYVNCPCEECRDLGSQGGGRGPFKGLGEVHPGKLTKNKDGRTWEVDRDPIGVQSPRGTAETRAWREAGEKAEPTWFRMHASTLQQLEGKLKQAYEQEKLSRGPREEREPDPVVGEEIVVGDLPSGAAGVETSLAHEKDDAPPPAPKLEHHQPTTICPIEGVHDATMCGYHRQPKGNP